MPGGADLATVEIMEGGSWRIGHSWRRLKDAAQPVLDDPALDPVVDRLAAALDTRLDELDQERAGLSEPERRQQRSVLLTRVAMRHLSTVSALPRRDRSHRGWPLLFLAAAYRLRTRYSCNDR